MTTTSSTSRLPNLDRDLLIYIPCYNCADTVVGVVNAIPSAVADRARLLVVDNCSTDSTADRLLAARQAGEVKYPFFVVRPAQNLGYAGSQKLAYGLAIRQPKVRWVIMLHGDGQYPSELLSGYLAHLDTDCALVQGYRSKRAYPTQEETPWTTLFTIRTLGYLETLVTGVRAKEWHSGFVMYSTDFLRAIDLEALIDTPHIDGHLLFASQSLGFKRAAIPIYKRYRGLKAFSGPEAVRYALSVLYLAYGFRRTRDALSAHGMPNLPNFELRVSGPDLVQSSISLPPES